MFPVLKKVFFLCREFFFFEMCNDGQPWYVDVLLGVESVVGPLAGVVRIISSTVRRVPFGIGIWVWVVPRGTCPTLLGQ